MRLDYIKRVEEDVIRLEDGYFYYAPEGPGALSANNLRMIADHLDYKNKEWDDIVKNDPIIGGGDEPQTKS